MGFCYLHKGILCYLQLAIQDVHAKLAEMTHRKLMSFWCTYQRPFGDIFHLSQKTVKVLHSVELNYSAGAVSQISFKYRQVGLGSTAETQDSKIIIMSLCVIVYFLNIHGGLGVIPQELQMIHTIWNRNQQPNGFHQDVSNFV